MPPLPRRANAPVEVDAEALRAFIRTHNVSVPRLAEAMPCDRSYISKLQTGAHTRVAASTFRRLCEVLGVADDPRELMAQPEHFDPDADARTVAMVRPAADACGPPVDVGGEVPDGGAFAVVPEQRSASVTPGGRHRLDTAAAR